MPAGPLVVIAPHPDDEVFGAGGLVAMAAAKGLPVHVLMLTDGGGSHRGCCRADEQEVGRRRRELIAQAAKALGYPADDLHYFGQRDGALPHPGEPGFDELATEMADRIRDIAPATILAPHPLEGWQDHVTAELLARAAIAKLERPVQLIHYCVWFWFSLPLWRGLQLPWRAALTLDIEGVRTRKQAAMNIYLNASAPCGNPWVGRLPQEFLRAFAWQKELYFAADAARMM
ncbi:MAG: hypothetical protein A3K19_16390 [Lentisphaerae bacterium RIFOXYB12_FULL_65_16]|nr:MAG: hypothetical protein A3K18_32820 [Lentisphaerae bacterium RIFOXYA12_64_32]OGV89022.1 MAG: hypothetical protein A3K19_16390 [Lentisphaerae bacterium RIFOXYB12_FULL_65_16]